MEQDTVVQTKSIEGPGFKYQKKVTIINGEKTTNVEFNGSGWPLAVVILTVGLIYIANKTSGFITTLYSHYFNIK